MLPVSRLMLFHVCLMSSLGDSVVVDGLPKTLRLCWQLTRSRSTGYGSLSVWLTHLRTGMRFHKTYEPGNCSKSMWQGSAITIGGGYTWEDVYPEAFSRNLIIVGGGTPVS